MGRRLILDTNVLIAYERRTLDRSSFNEDDLAVAALSIAEYRVGIELADTASRAAQRARALAVLTAGTAVLDYTEATTSHHAGLIGHTRRAGRHRGPYDLIIAAHAVESDRIVVSRHARARFGDLPGVIAIEP